MSTCRNALLAAAVALPIPALAGEPVDIELVLAIDVSGSVNSAEQDLQRTGLIKAFSDASVIDAIRALPNGLAVAVVAWASLGQQRTVVGWSRLTDDASAQEFARRIGAAFPVVFEYGNKTSLGEALAWSLAELEGNAFDGRAKIDVSGDGHNNCGTYPHEVRDTAIGLGVTINGLAIVNEEPGLADYYRRNVIGGPGAFVMTAESYDSFGEAIRLKLLREIMPGPTARLGEAE